MSKSSVWTRTVTRSAAGHRWEQGDLVARLHRMGEADIVLVDRDLHRLALLQRCRIIRAEAFQPVEQLADLFDMGRQVEFFFGLADLLAQPGEIQQLHDLYLIREQRRPMAK